jgi:hypothetical protein
MRRLSRAVGLCCFGILSGFGTTALSQDPNIRVDNTGMMWRRQFRTVQKPVTETKLEPKMMAVSRPEVVTETEPVTTTYFTPVVRHTWQPRWKGMWNPFAPPTLAYELAPETTWQARSETLHRTKTSTRWVTENKVIQEPKLVTTIQENQEEYWVAIGPADANPAKRGSLNSSTQVGTQVASLPASASQPRTKQPGRPENSGGMPPTVLDPYSTRTYSTTPIFR